MRNQKGFSLLGTVIALGLITIAGIMAVQYQLRQARAQVAKTWIEAQAREMDQIAVAVRTWTNVPQNVASWTNDTRTGIACSTLVSAGLLPTAFGRDSVACKGPFGTIYTVFAIKNSADTTVPTGRVRAVIYLTGTHTPGILRRAGIPNNASDIQGIAMRTATQLAERKVPAGWLTAGNTTATGVGRAWSKALNLWINPAPTQASAVALVGFPDLDTGGGGGPSDTNPLYSQCRIVADHCGRTYPWGGCEVGYATTPMSCGTQEVEVKVMDACNAAPMEFIQGLNATLTAGEYESAVSPGRSYADCEAFAAAACVGNPDTNCTGIKVQECTLTGSTDVTTIATISLNNERQLSTFCGFRDDHFAGTGASAALVTQSYGVQRKSARVCCTRF